MLQNKLCCRTAVITARLVYGGTCLFLAYVLYSAFLTGLMDPELPDRFAPWFSKLLLFLCVAAGCAAFCWISDRTRFAEKLSPKYGALGFFLLALAISLGPAALTAIQPMSDFQTYYQLAAAIAEGGVFVPVYVASFPHVIGFPAALSVVFRLTGASVFAAQCFGICLSALSVSFAYLLCTRTLGRRAGFWAALLWLICPSRVLYTLLISTENLFNALALAALLVFLLAAEALPERRGKGLILYGCAGLLLSMLSAVRPNGAILLIACILLFFFQLICMQRPGRSGLFKSLLAPVILISVYLVTSMAFNAAIEWKIGQEIARTKSGWSLFVGMNRQFRGQWNGEDSKLFAEALKEQGPEGMQLTFLSMGKDRLAAQFREGTLLPFITDKVSLMWHADHEAVSYIHSALARSGTAWAETGFQKVLKLSCDGYYLLLAALSACALLLQMRRRNNCEVRLILLLGCLIVLGTAALHIPFEAAMRYKNHAVLWMAVFSAACLLGRKTGQGVMRRKKTAKGL